MGPGHVVCAFRSSNCSLLAESCLLIWGNGKEVLNLLKVNRRTGDSQNS
jgi:hypothetical protein